MAQLKDTMDDYHYDLPVLLEPMTLPSSPVEIHRAVVAQLVEHPETHQQYDYSQHGGCGTTCCYAGLGLLLAGLADLGRDGRFYDAKTGKRIDDPGTSMLELLGLQRWEAFGGYDGDPGEEGFHEREQGLFNSYNTYEQTLTNAERYARQAGGTVLDIIEAKLPGLAREIREELETVDA